MQRHELQVSKPARKQRVGRGGVRGKTAGRGMKGQKARAGHRIRPALRDTIKKLPKQRGYREQSRREDVARVNLAIIEQQFAAGEKVTPKTLVAKGVLRSRDIKRGVKILGNGELKKKVMVEGCACSQTAREQITAAGGEVNSPTSAAKAAKK